jgi:hypothetical protein
MPDRTGLSCFESVAGLLERFLLKVCRIVL